MSLINSSPATPAEQAANRANSRRSTGPRTAQGKGRSRWNALRHGGWASGLAWSEEALQAMGEDPKEFAQLRQRLLATPGPAEDPLWGLQLEDLARLYWRRQRLERAWEEGARRQGREAVLMPTTSPGALLLQQLESVDRAIDRKTRLLLRLREAVERTRQQAERRQERERRARERQAQASRWGDEFLDGPLGVEELEVETRRLRAELEALEKAGELEERSQQVDENKDTEGEEVTSDKLPVASEK
jgi:hypothetical protein